ncbi:hypothetical protein OS493_011843 [Desmophyllum pertusum]|uniref:Uncharacterized protein n=1 Tax=Desmophyllum pertusum TaxID=174260 RepID=A0A9X0CHL0_9CNID|nr:hypothetical protein OS493_011843 [Desmophyllum pertusum]
MLTIIICVLYLNSQALAEDFTEGFTCPTDWLYLNGSCYRAYSTEQSWFDAAKFCQENQGELLSINSEGEQRFVYQRMAVNKTLWIGLVKDRSLGSFRWSNGDRLTYENWIIGEGSISGSEDCGEMTDYSVFHGQWNDKTCSVKQPYICEKGALRGRYFKSLPRRRLNEHVISQVTASSDIECLLLCQRHQNCMSVNYRPGDSRSTSPCELNGAIAKDFPGDLTDSMEFNYYESLV